MKQKGFIIPLVILGIVVFVIVVAGAFYVGKTINTPPDIVPIITSTPKPSIIPGMSPASTTSDETANWKTCINKEWGFSISYPQDLYFSRENRYLDGKIADCVEFAPTDLFIKKLPQAVTYTIRIYASKNTKGLKNDPDQLFGNGPGSNYDFQAFKKSENVTIQNILFGGIKSFRVDGCCGGMFGIATMVMVVNNNQVYEIQVEPMNGLTGNQETNKKIYDQILSTFKFLK